MPAEVLAFRNICGRFAARYISFMTKRAKLAFASLGYTRKARKAQTQCVLLTAVIVQLLLCAGDIEQNPGPDHETESLLQTMFSQQYDKLLTLFEQKLNERFQSFSDGVLKKLDTVCSTIQEQIQILHSRITKLEENFSGMEQELKNAQSSISGTEEQLATTTADLEDKIDKLESYSRRDNLRFFNVPESDDDDYDSCANKVLDVLENTMPGKRWYQDDIVRAHRLGAKRSGYNRRPRPIMVKFSRWRDKMDILTKGREKLLNKGIHVAGDLTTKQQNTVREHREKGVRAYYKGNQLVVAGPLHYHPLNRGTFADVVRRDANPSTRRGKAKAEYHQGQRKMSRERQSSRRREDYRPYSPDHTGNASRHQDSQIPVSCHETADPYGSNWSEGDEWNYRYSPYNWQYYSSWQDFRDYPQHLYQSHNPENLIPVSAGVLTDRETTGRLQNPSHPSRSSPGQSPSSPSCLPNSVQSAQDAAAHVVTTETTAGDGVTEDTRRNDAGAQPGTSSESTSEPPANSQEAVPIPLSCAEVEPDGLTQLPENNGTTPREEQVDDYHDHTDVGSLSTASGTLLPDEQSGEHAAGVPDASARNTGPDAANQAIAKEAVPKEPVPSNSSKQNLTGADAKPVKHNSGSNTAVSSDCNSKHTRISDTQRRLRSMSLSTTAGEKKQLTLSETVSIKSSKNVNKQNNNNK